MKFVGLVTLGRWVGMLRIGEGLVASVKALVFLNWVINAYIFIFIGIFLSFTDTIYNFHKYLI